MGLNRLTIAVVIALLGGTPALHAETAAQPDAVPAEAAAADPALAASPIAGSETVVQAPAEAQPAPAADESEPVVHPADVIEPPPAAGKGDTLTLPKTTTKAKKRAASSMPIKVEVDGMPGRGASMAQVEKQFGQPREKLPAVGNPPITRWNYGDYTVYFEHEYVVHSVKNDGVSEPVTAPAEAPAPADTPAPAAQPATTE